MLRAETTRRQPSVSGSPLTKMRSGISALGEEAHRLIIEACPVGIVVAAMSGEIVVANTEMGRMLGYVPNHLVGRNLQDFLPLNVSEPMLPSDPDGEGASPETSKRLLSIKRRDGGKLPVEVSLRHVSTAEGCFVVAIVVDITERARAERVKDEFLATVSHELRTPLTSIGGALGLLVASAKASDSLPASTVRLLTIAHANSQRLARLVNAILDMEKLESGKVVFVLKRVDVRSLVEQAIETSRSLMNGSGIRLRFCADDPPADIRADPHWVVQIVTNLLSNAIKFSPAGEEVVVSLEQRGGTVRISVRDHGPGVPESFRPFIFNKFAQADNADNRQEGGPGLGLSIVRAIVEKLGGSVGFGDAPGGGAIFHVDLPGWEQVANAAPGTGDQSADHSAPVEGF